MQFKPLSSHDPKFLIGMSKGFVHRAISIFSINYAELSFLIDIFVENGYKRS